jgi:hypothetical protein
MLSKLCHIPLTNVQQYLVNIGEPQMTGLCLGPKPPKGVFEGNGKFGRFWHFDEVLLKSTISTVLVESSSPVSPSPTRILLNSLIANKVNPIYINSLKLKRFLQ